MPRTVSERYRDVLRESLSVNFRGARSLVVLTDDEVLSPDILSYFAQLEPILQKDKTLWCVSAWNNHGLASYVADHTALMRTDWFSGVAWMVRGETVLKELLSTW